jgi:HAD superfamily hydrolase (TIGR01490 family)
MAGWAVFDVDGTLLPETSMEKEFAKYLLRSRVIHFTNLLSFLLDGFGNLLNGEGWYGFKRSKKYFQGIPVSLIKEKSIWFFENKIWPAISREGLNTVEQYQNDGYKILTVSGSPDFLTNQLAKKVNADFSIACSLEKKGDVYTGNVKGFHPYGEQKKKLLLNVKERLQIEFEKSAVFANHQTDVVHMEMFGKAVAVNPTPVLERIAEGREWEIKIW